MDEPTSFLDPVGAEKIFEVLKFLNKEFGMTIILIEHRMDLAVKYVNRIIVFNNGKIVSDGPPKQVFKDESLRLLGVGIPRIIELTRLLKNQGLTDFKTPISAQEFYNQIQSKFKTKKIFSYDIPLDLKDLTGEYSHIPTLRVDNVSFSYPSGVKALHNVSLTINQGEYIAIMGENGAGKTTLVKHFNGLLKPLKGKIYFNKNDISTSSVASLAKKIGLVFQNPDDQLFEETVEKEISFALKNFGFQKEIINERVEWALNLLDLTEYRESSPFTLSGGERKRVALASVLAWDPDVLVLDEPTIGQDYGQKERLRHFLNQLRTQGKTIVIVTHDVEFVAESQPRIVLMAHGEIIGDGTSKKIMTNIKKLEESSVAQPEITRLFSLLQKHGYPNNILDVEEAYELLVNEIMENSK
jgi:energy-coupling factor transport system ATP-binding protein